MTARVDKTALSYWFPKLVAAGLPVPRTKIVEMSRAAQEDIWAAFDGKEGPGGMKAFVADIEAAAAEFGFPCFLRTDHTSGKHDWGNTCFLPSAKDIAQHVFAIAEYSECADMIGLPWTTWAVREFLPTVPFGVCKNFGNMPVCREFRFFVKDDEIQCWHPYWPREALEQGDADASLDYEALCRMTPEEGAILYPLACAAGLAVGGAWSVDILETQRGWAITDMAEASKSYHWEGCPHADG
jgi:hypothetical protein